MMDLCCDCNCHVIDLYSNMDHRFKTGAVKKIKSGKYLGAHSAMNFHSLIYFKNGYFYATIRRYHEVVANLKDKNIEDLIEKTNDKYGRE